MLGKAVKCWRCPKGCSGSQMGLSSSLWIPAVPRAQRKEMLQNPGLQCQSWSWELQEFPGRFQQSQGCALWANSQRGSPGNKIFTPFSHSPAVPPWNVGFRMLFPWPGKVRFMAAASPLSPPLHYPALAGMWSHLFPQKMPLPGALPHTRG